MTNVQMGRKTTYTLVASQAFCEVMPAMVDVDPEMGAMHKGPLGLPVVPVTPVLGVFQAQDLLIQGVDCHCSMGALLTVASGLRVGECSVGGVQWLLSVGRCWYKSLLSVVVYLDHPVAT